MLQKPTTVNLKPMPPLEGAGLHPGELLHPAAKPGSKLQDQRPYFIQEQITKSQSRVRVKIIIILYYVGSFRDILDIYLKKYHHSRQPPWPCGMLSDLCAENMEFYLHTGRKLFYISCRVKIHVCNKYKV